MLIFIAPAVVWLIILFFTSAEFYTRFSMAKSILLSTLLNIVLFVICTLIWFSAESDGLAQLIGSTIYAGLCGLCTMSIVLIMILLH